MDPTTDIHQKALSINLDKGQYGTIAEIGAGQETARWFFRVGGAAGTIAKAISAYDMQFSDSIYGESPRYVSRDRLSSMLDLEYQLIIERLGNKRGDESTFFSFANTVASRSFSRDVDGQGWIGVKFQSSPCSEPSQIDLHVHLQGKKSIQDQETLGILGVNLIYAALYFHQDPQYLLKSLMDDLSFELLEIDMIDFSGPAFESVDNRLMALRLVELGMTPGAMFNSEGEIVLPADVLYKKAVLIERSRFNPPTLLNMDMLDCAQEIFLDDHDLSDDELMVISEMTVHNLKDGSDIDVEDFLQRADILCALGKNVLISNMGEYYKLADYLFRCTTRPMAIALGIPTLKDIFNEHYYENLPGGILEAFGRLFKYELRLYVSPCCKNNDINDLTTTDNFEPEENLKHLYHYLVDNKFISPLNTVNRDFLCIHSHEVLEEIKNGHNNWETKVPEKVKALIKDKKLLNVNL
ncbi:MAG: nicotinate-nucleotide adenylyltransferase [endosymbiont of Galathealinum brachiosum]|uniref:Nicotinate-nucleotide adenylyltransferase n=1 Tax=endosymbiont of Galathealinum brachiosum TaxID=2200906 RepID=A0A370DHL2_9GAMM|nr:MAG: nicotinate-nucleotide adenylyltransferase [endosymbiont of Galathealinum brachiosum]